MAVVVSNLVTQNRDFTVLQGGAKNDHALRQRTVLDPTYIKPK